MVRRGFPSPVFPNTAQTFLKKIGWPAEDAEEQNEVPAPACSFQADEFMQRHLLIFADFLGG